MKLDKKTIVGQVKLGYISSTIITALMLVGVLLGSSMGMALSDELNKRIYPNTAVATDVAYDIAMAQQLLYASYFIQGDEALPTVKNAVYTRFDETIALEGDYLSSKAVTALEGAREKLDGIYEVMKAQDPDAFYTAYQELNDTLTDFNIEMKAFTENSSATMIGAIEFLDKMMTYTGVIFTLIVIFMFSVYVAFYILIPKRIQVSIGAISEIINGIKNAKYSAVSEIPTDETELGQLGEVLKGTALQLGDTIKIIDRELSTMASGNLSFNPQIEAMPGELSHIKTAINYIQKQLSKTLEEVTYTATNLAEGAESLAVSASEMATTNIAQSKAIEEFNDVTTEVISSTDEMSENIKRCTTISVKSETSAQRGSQVVTELVDNIGKVSHYSNEISRILLTIEKIAQQTNLLALNASIEAARAGESGKGFAVVASEIRTLANDTSETVKQIEEMIGSTLSSIRTGEQSADNTKAILDEITASILATNQITDQLHSSSLGQHVTLDHLKKGTTNIAKLISNNATSAEINANISKELAAQSESLRELIGQFKY